MKLITATDKFGLIHENCYLLETLQDFQQYVSNVEQDIDSEILRLIKSPATPDRYDHMLDSSDADSIIAGGIAVSKMTGKSWISEVAKISSQKFQNILKLLFQGQSVLINQSGGYCPFDDYFVNVIEHGPVSNDPKFHTINRGTKYINLENDPTLERHTIDYLSTVDENFSYVCNLRRYTKQQLTKVLKEFKQCGGEIIYVYTTGLDVDQMYQYLQAIVDAGLQTVEFEFSTGIEQYHEKVIKYARDELSLSVRILNEEKGS